MSTGPGAGVSTPTGPSATEPAVEVTTGPGGQAAARVRGEDGAWLPLHVVADPRAAAAAQLSSIEVPPEVLVIVGAGLGYLTEAAYERWPSATIVVVEPVAALAAAARARHPRLYDAPHVQLLSAPCYDGADGLWRLFDSPRFASAGPPVVAELPLARALPTRMRDAAAVVGRALAAARMNAAARAENAGRYLANTLRNLGHVTLGPDPARLRDRFAGVPAVVVGAGPSLDTVLPRLRAVADRALVIATDTSWRPLVHGGVTPHLVVGLDPTPANGRHFLDLPHGDDTWVIAEGSLDPAALAAHAGRVATFRVAAHHPWPWLQSLGHDRLLLRAWGSVLTSAFDLALVCGCDPIVFLGADLAFTGGQPYCRGTTMEEAWAEHAARGVSVRQTWRHTLDARALLRERDINGAEVETAPHLVEFRNWLVARAGESAPRTIVNASGAGILAGPGIRQTRLEDVLADAPRQDARIRATVREALTGRGDDSGGSMAAATAAVAGSRADTSPLADWTAFAEPTLTEDQVRGAARAGASALLRRPAPVVAPDPRPARRWYVADRVAAMRARLSGDATGLDGTVSAPTRSREAAHIDAVALLSRLLAEAALVTEPGADVAAGASAATVPLSARFVWRPHVAPWVAAFEEALLDGQWPAPHPVNTEPGGYWQAGAAPVICDDQPGVAGDPLDASARAALIAEHLVVSDVGRGAAGDTRMSRLVDAAQQALALPAWQTSMADGIDLHLAGSHVRAPIVIDALMGALTGTLVTADGRDEPRTAFLRADADHIEPELLTDCGVTGLWSVTTRSDADAVIVPIDSGVGLLIGAAGRPRPGTPWPTPITGEVPWGDAGGALAWHGVTRVTHWRRVRGGATATAEAPFRPFHLAVDAAGDAFWTDADGGLWQWRPGETARRLVTLPASGIPRMSADDLLVAPMPRDGEGRVVRTRLSHEWRVERSTGAIEVVATGPEGQVGKVATRGAWTAASHPGADLVRLSAPGREAWWLACRAPLGVAWAGASLVVVATGPHALRFPRLFDRLEATPAGPSLAP